MKKLRRSFERFCFKHRNIGIPNLMLYIGIGTALVYVANRFFANNLLTYLLCFNREAILRGEVWRLLTFIFTYESGPIFGDSLIPTAITLFCCYSLGKAMENIWGTLRFNLYYLCGILLTIAYGMIFGGYVSVIYLNLSLFMAYATLYPDAQFLLFYIIPIKGRFLALFDIGLMLFAIFSGLFLLPVTALLNYFLFFGKDVTNIFPMSWRANFSRLFRKKKAKSTPKVIPFPSAGSYQASTTSVKAPYTHRCTVCGKTDVTNPDLEFRYCSRCNGFHCYCQDHISNHNHQ